MRGFAGRRGSRSDPDPFKQGIVAGVILALLAAAGLKLVSKLHAWASSRPIVPDIVAALTEPTISVLNLASIVLVLLFFWIVSAMMMMHRGGST